MLSQNQTNQILRIIAKIWSVLSIVFMLVIVIGESLGGEDRMPAAVEWVGLMLFSIGVMIGLVLAWWREGLGGTISVLCLIAFYIWDFVRSGYLPGGPFFLLVTAPGVLFLACWFWSRDHSEIRHA